MDPTGKKNGRGAYLTGTLDVIKRAEDSNILSRQLNAEVDASIYEELRKLVSQDT